MWRIGGLIGSAVNLVPILDLSRLLRSFRGGASIVGVKLISDLLVVNPPVMYPPMDTAQASSSSCRPFERELLLRIVVGVTTIPLMTSSSSSSSAAPVFSLFLWLLQNNVESTILLVSLINQALDSSSMFTNVCY